MDQGHAGREGGGLCSWVCGVLSLVCCKPEFLFLLRFLSFFLHQASKGFAMSVL